MPTTNDRAAAKYSLTITTPTDREIVATRTFDAPRRLVWECFTSSKHLPNWMLGPAGWTMPVCEIDLREGGGWRYVIREHDDIEVGFHGEYREISRPRRLVWTEMYEGVPNPGPDKYPVCTTTLEEVDGVTTLTTVVQHTSKEDRDAVLATGMESGMQISYDRLEDLVREGA